MTFSRRALGVLRPLLRAAVRYGPRGAWRSRLWERVIEPYLAWEAYSYRARTTFGARMAGDTRDILQQYVYYFGHWEPSLTGFLSRRLRDGDTFIDVGANVGYYTLLASRLVGSGGRVVSMEPSPRLFAALQAHLADNGCANVRPLQCAVLDEVSVVRLYGGTPYHSGLTTTREERGLEFECEVPAARLGQILIADEWERARIVKIDVEGAEGSVVAGIAPLLKTSRDDLEVVVEIDAELLAGQGQSAEELVRIFRGAGFHPYLLENDYTASRYLERRPPARPKRWRGPLAGVADVVFSRVDAEELS